MTYSEAFALESPPDGGVLCRLDQSGDLRTTWRRDNPDEVELAREAFESARRKGYLAYRVTEDGSKGEVMREFDPAARRVILAPPLQGGSAWPPQ